MPVYYVPVSLRMEFPICTAAFQENTTKLGQKSQNKDSIHLKSIWYFSYRTCEAINFLLLLLLTLFYRPRG